MIPHFSTRARADAGTTAPAHGASSVGPEAASRPAAAHVVLRDTCNACPAVGQCWKAMLAGAEVEECRGFCPNAEAFDRLATE